MPELKQSQKEAFLFFLMKTCKNEHRCHKIKLYDTFISCVWIWIAIAYSKCSESYCACSFTCCILAGRDVAIQYWIILFLVSDGLWKDKRCCVIAYTSLRIICDHIENEIKRFTRIL